jgi:hypothetical protein
LLRLPFFEALFLVELFARLEPLTAAPFARLFRALTVGCLGESPIAEDVWEDPGFFLVSFLVFFGELPFEFFLFIDPLIKCLVFKCTFRPLTDLHFRRQIGQEGAGRILVFSWSEITWIAFA